MASISYGQLRRKFVAYIERVCGERTPLFVDREEKRGVVLSSEDEYAGLMETIHLLKSPTNAIRLLRSINDANEGKIAG
jgi:antitoxin YefM